MSASAKRAEERDGDPGSECRLEPFASETGWRRGLTFLPVALISGLGIWLMAVTVAANGLTVPEAALLVVFAPTFGWITFSFWIALIGFFLRLTGRHPITLRRIATGVGPGRPLGSRTAIVMPICNEDVPRVFAGLLATCRSLQQTGAVGHFDCFVLSDTTKAGGGRSTPGARPGTSPTGSRAAAGTTSSWWCWMPTASCPARPWCGWSS
jgi:membrane glycosyltransferase